MTWWCVVLLATALESNVPKMCFPERETCLAFIINLEDAQCSRRNK